MTTTSTGRILLIEDERELRNALKLILEMNKFTVYAAQNGLEGLSMLNENVVDIIICDINLPDITGHDIIDAVRSDKQHYKLPFIFLTAYADERDIRKGMNEGADDYLTKPFSANELVAAIKAQLLLSKKNKMFHEDEINQNWIKVINHNFKQEFLTPLHSIMNATYLIDSVQSPVANSDFKETINAIYNSSFRMFRNTRNLIIYSILAQDKIKSANNSLNDSAFVSDTLTQIVDYYNNGLTYNYSQINAHIDFVPGVAASKDYLNIIFTELIDNAVKYDANKLPPKVSLTATATGFEFCTINRIRENIQFDVNDIYQFRKFHEDLSLNGLGVGLYLCKMLCKELSYDFSINIENNFIKISVVSKR